MKNPEFTNYDLTGQPSVFDRGHKIGHNSIVSDVRKTYSRELDRVLRRQLNSETIDGGVVALQEAHQGHAASTPHGASDHDAVAAQTASAVHGLPVSAIKTGTIAFFAFEKLFRRMDAARNLAR